MNKKSNNLNNLLEFNKQFVNDKQYKNYNSTKYPCKKIAVLSCMDTRLTELLPAALNIKNGDVKIIKNAGAQISHPFGSVMKSLLIAVYNLEVTDIMVVGHLDCGVKSLNYADMSAKMLDRGITKEAIDSCGIDLTKWLKGFKSERDSVIESVNLIKHHPLLPKDVNIYGFLIDPTTGELSSVI